MNKIKAHLTGWATAAAFVCFMSNSLCASPISFDFSGAVDPQALAGDHFFGTFTFDPSEATAIPTDNPPFTATYELGPSSRMTVQVDDQPARVDTGNLQMRVAQFPADKGFSQDSSQVEIWSAADQNGLGAVLSVGRVGSLMYPSLLPPESFRLSDFTGASFAIASRTSNARPWSGFVSTLGPSSSADDPAIPTPEPACTSLICIAVAGLLAITRHRTRRDQHQS